MKLYLAARYPRRAEIAAYAKELQAMGHEITSRWLWGSHEAMDYGQAAAEDMDDIRQADAVISFTELREQPWPQGGNNGGRHVEFGYAYGLLEYYQLEWLVIVGHRENVFHHLPDVTYCETWGECKEWLRDA